MAATAPRFSRPPQTAPACALIAPVPLPFFLDIGTCEFLVLNANGGNDSFSATGNLAALIQITVDGGAGEDTLLGGNGADVLMGGDDNDFIDGNQGADMVFGGPGNDVFQWDPGDGSDTIEGQAGNDRLVFNGANIGENFAVVSMGPRVRFTRDIASVLMDIDDVEILDVNALGGADSLTVNDLVGTDLTTINANLASTVGGGVGDGQPDNVIVNATNGIDNVVVTGSGTGASVSGLFAVVNVATAEVANDRFTINALGGNDNVQATGLASGVIGLTINGGTGDDTLVGSAGVDLLNGEDDNDTITGGPGNDNAQLGLGNDRFIWNPGDDADIVDGLDGVDVVQVNGDNVDEIFTTTANGVRVRFDRTSPAPFFLDIGTCENLVVDANGGNDSFSATGNLAALIQITVNGGAGDDTLLGATAPTSSWAATTMTSSMATRETIWFPAAPVTTLSSGTRATVATSLKAAPARTSCSSTARLSPKPLSSRPTGRGCSSLATSATSPGRRRHRAVRSSGARRRRHITVNSLAGTDIAQVNLELAGTLGGGAGDAAADVITVNGTAAADTFNLVAVAGVVEVNGLATQVRVIHPEVANDSLTINGLGGVDTFNVGLGVTGLIGVTTNQ